MNKYTASLVKLNIDERIITLRKQALERGIPVADDETLQFLLLTVTALQPKRILEIGTAVGLSQLYNGQPSIRFPKLMAQPVHQTI